MYNTLLFIFHANDIFFTFCLFCFLNLRRVFYRDAIYKESYAHAPVPSSMTAYVLTLRHHIPAQEDNTTLILLLVILVISKARNPVLGNAPLLMTTSPHLQCKGPRQYFYLVELMSGIEQSFSLKLPIQCQKLSRYHSFPKEVPTQQLCI